MNRGLKIRNIVVLAVTIGTIAVSLPAVARADSGCRYGASPMANAYVRLNPMYAYYYGDVASYVGSNPSNFLAGADAIRCARALSGALMAGAIQAYDPNDFNRRAEMNARLGAMGINPGPAQPSLSTELYAMSQTLARLARVLPAAALGDYGPLNTPTTELEQMQLFAAQMFQVLMQDPMTQSVMQQMEPMIREAAELEYKILTDMARELD